MLEIIKTNEKIKDLIKEISVSPKYNKNNRQDVLILFYDALYKYELIINNNSYLEKYLNDFETLLTKIDDLEEIKYGVSKILLSIVQKMLIENSREDILKYFYNKYIENGYYIRGLNKKEYISLKTNNILDNKEILINELKTILEKYKIDILTNYNNKASFSTNFIVEATNSINSPLYLYSLVEDNKYTNEAFFLKDQDKCIENINKVLGNTFITKEEQTRVLDIFKELWNYYELDNNIYLVLFKRSNNQAFVDNPSLSLEEAVYNILSAYVDYSDININLDSNNCIFIDLPSIKEEKEVQEEIIAVEINNEYGKVSMLFILSTILITIGVIVTIILILTGGI